MSGSMHIRKTSLGHTTPKLIFIRVEKDGILSQASREILDLVKAKFQNLNMYGHEDYFAIDLRIDNLVILIHS